MSRGTLKSTLRLSPSLAAAKRVFDRALNKRRKKVKFCKIIHKKNITPLDSKIKRRSFGEYFDGGDPALSFTELTDHSAQSFDNKESSPPQKINSSVTKIATRGQRRRSNLFLRMSSSSIKTFFSPRSVKRSVPSVPDDEDDDADVLIVDEVSSAQKTTSSEHSAQEPIVISLSDSTLEESVIIEPIVTRPTPKLWVDAFIPKKKADIINGPPMDAFNEWLKFWKKRLTMLAKIENEPPKKKRKSRKHEDDDSDYEPEQDASECCSTFVLSGPTGCGKTSFVHFLAKEHGFNVIELSTSDERSGATMKNKLQGAMENFAVRGPGDIRTMMFGGKRANDDGIKHNLVLIDDADVVFKSDTGFWSKLGSFSVESKIPIVLTCTNRQLVVCNMENSEYEGENFLKRDKKVITRHLKEWISNYAGVTIDESIIADTVKESKQDVRKALNNLEFNGGKLFVTNNSKFPKFSSMSSQNLAEFDCILTKCNEFEKKSKTRWNAQILSNIDFIPDKCPIQTCDIPGVDNNNEQFIDDLSNIFSLSLPEEYEDLEKQDERLSTNLLSCRGIYAPILPAIYDTFKRCEPGASPRNVALYELPILASIHRGWCERIKNKASRRRVCHPFNDVPRVSGKALDRLGKLHTTIDQYCTWS